MIAVTPPFSIPSPGGEMKCPTCGDNTPDDWRALVTGMRNWTGRTGIGMEVPLEALAETTLPDRYDQTVSFDWMRCAADGCDQLVIRMHFSHRKPDLHAPVWETSTWTIWPRNATRQLEPGVPDPYAKDFREAAALLTVSPRMSAVLSRRILFDLLEQYAQISEYTLKGSLDKFIADTAHPLRIRENLQHLREIGDFGAHTKKDGADEIIDVSAEHAGWTLDVIDRLFDYFIRDPQRDLEIRAAWDKNLADAGRNPIPPAPPDPGVSSE